MRRELRRSLVLDIALSSVRHGVRQGCSGGTEPAKSLHSLSCCSSVLLRKGFQMASFLPLTCPLCPTEKISASDSPSWALEVALRCSEGPPLPRLKQPWSTSHCRQYREPMARPPRVISRESLPSAVKCTVPFEL